MTAYPSGWYPTTSSSSPSFNLFIPYTSSYSRETHEMYNELGFILRPSKSTTPSPSTTTNSKSSFTSLGSSFSLTKSRSYVNEMVRRLLKHTQLSGPSGHQVAFPIDKRRVAIAWPYSPSLPPDPPNILIRVSPTQCPASVEPTHTPSTSRSIEMHTPNQIS